MLREESAIGDEVIAARGYRTITDPAELRGLGFAPQQCRPGLLLPLHTPDGGNGVYVLRPDAPRSLDEKDKPRLPDGTYPQRVLKYEFPKGEKMRLDCPPTCRADMGNPAIPLWITEGQRKADALASLFLCAVALLGVWNFKGRNALGGSTVLADWDYIALKGRAVRIVFDSDVMRKVEVQQALKRLTAMLQNRGASVTAIYLPHGPDGRKQGVDDFLAAGHTAADLEALVEAPRPQPMPAAPDVELLEAEPGILRRPLALIGGHAHAATWLHVRETRRESVNRAGELVRHDPPVVTTGLRQFIIRDDGRVFGDGGDAPMADLGCEVRLPEIPPADKLWSARGVKAYKAGQRPEPADVFHRVVDTVDRFIDFDRSLAEQRTMAELDSCYSMASWFLDAFNVTSNLWPSGDRGSGKTQLLTVTCEIGYLGQVILAGGSYASLRDLADYGAMLAFDDAENLSDPRKTDPDKRALLLAGNRRGNTVPVKEPTGDRTWRTRYVSTLTPRLFSATRLPDPILASRTIVVPLIRTPDRYRANADPLDYALWPHERRQLLDDLWALALAHLAELPRYEAQVNERARLMGRALEPWRALLAVALWLDERGVTGLWGRMEALSVSYQEERPDLEVGDMTALVIRTLLRCAADDISTKGDVTDINPVTFAFSTSLITKTAKELVEEQELDFDAEAVNARRIGRTLGRMRIKAERTSKARGWRMTFGDVERWAVFYGIPLPDELAKLQTSSSPLNVTNVMDVITSQPEPGREVFEL